MAGANGDHRQAKDASLPYSDSNASPFADVDSIPGPRQHEALSSRGSGMSLRDSRGRLGSRAKSVSRSAGKGARKATSLAFYWTVPETARDSMPFRVVVGLGAFTILACLTAFIVLFIYYGQCQSQDYLTLQGRTSSGKTLSGCSENVVTQNSQLALDLNFNWADSPQFAPAKGLYQIKFTEYQKNDTTTKQELYGLVQQMYDLLGGLSGLYHYQVVQRLLYSFIAAPDVINGGYMQLVPNFDLGTYIGGVVTSWADARNLSRWQGVDVDTPELMYNYTFGRYSKPGLPGNQSICSEARIEHGYNFLKYYDNHAVTSLVVEDDFPPINASSPLVQQYEAAHAAWQSNPTGPYYNYQPTTNGSAQLYLINSYVANATTGECVLQPLVVNDASDIPVLSKLLAYVNRQNVYTIEWDIPQVFAMDYCNNNLQMCLAYLNNVTNGTAASLYDIAAQGLLSTMGSAELFPTYYEPSINKLGFLWSTNFGTEYTSTEADNRTFLVVPQLVPDFSCTDCAAPPSSDCMKFLGIELHYYYFGYVSSTYDDTLRGKTPAPPLAPTTSTPGHLPAYYFYTYEYNLVTTGAMNSLQSMVNLQCSVTGMYFEQTGEQLLNEVSSPFATTSGVYSCTSQVCKSPLERLSLVFSNVTLFYSLLSLTAICIAIFGWRRKPEEVIAKRMGRSGRDVESGRLSGGGTQQSIETEYAKAMAKGGKGAPVTETPSKS